MKLSENLGWWDTCLIPNSVTGRPNHFQCRAIWLLKIIVQDQRKQILYERKQKSMIMNGYDYRKYLFQVYFCSCTRNRRNGIYWRQGSGKGLNMQESTIYKAKSWIPYLLVKLFVHSTFIECQSDGERWTSDSLGFSLLKSVLAELLQHVFVTWSSRTGLK